MRRNVDLKVGPPLNQRWVKIGSWHGFTQGGGVGWFYSATDDDYGNSFSLEKLTRCEKLPQLLLKRICTQL